MTRRWTEMLFAALLCASPLAAQTELVVTSAGPTGEVASLEQVNEIRIRFSEPMVALGRIPDQVHASFFSIRPAIDGTFRWAGPTILIFTPEAASRLPNATRYEVTVSTAATAVSGRRLTRPYSFQFTTPTVRLLRVETYQENDQFDSPLKIALRFNQPVRPADVMAHASLRYTPREWEAPALDVRQRARMGPASVAAFEQKVAAARSIARSTAAVPFLAAADWDRRRFPPDPTLVVLETTGAPSPGGLLRLTLDRLMPSAEGSATPEAQQQRDIELAEMLFVRNFACRQRCDADGYNAGQLSVNVALDDLGSAMTVHDITASPEVVVGKAAAPLVRREVYDDIRWFNLEEVGYERQPPSRTYAISVNADLRAADGQRLGYTFVDVVENWHMRAFTSFGDGHGVWERSGGRQLPFYARNLTSATQWVMPLRPEQLMSTVRSLQKGGFREAPPVAGTRRSLTVTPDVIQSHGLDLSQALSTAGAGLVWAAIEPGAPIPQSRFYSPDVEPRASRRAAVVQVTNLGVTVKDSPAGTLVFVTTLDSAVPVPAAKVTIVGLDGVARWTGQTDAQGVVVAPAMKLRNPRAWHELGFIVTAEKDGDIAYVASDWNEGISPWEFDTPLDLFEADPLLRGTVFTDRGVYRPGEEVHFKAVVRADAPSGIELFKPGTALHIAVRDSRDRTIDRRSVTLNQWSTTEWTMRVPSGGSLGDYQVIAALDGRTVDADQAPARPREEDNTSPPYWKQQLRGRFLVAAYRRPDFRVDTTLEGPVPVAGAPLTGSISARYLFGATMGKRPAKWTLSRTPIYEAPASVADKYPPSRFVFVGCCDDRPRASDEQISARSAALDARGALEVELETRASDGLPYQYMFEADVEDVSRQHIANRSIVVVHPASFYVGLERPPFFVEQRDGLSTTVVAVSPASGAVPGVRVDVELFQVQWHSVRRAEGSGFFTWETERKEIQSGTFTVTTGAQPAPLRVSIREGGLYLVKATARDEEGRLATTRMQFYVVGGGYTAWERFDHNRIELIPEQESYKPGETARLMIKSPWERATALLTVEREGIRSHRQFALTSTQQTVEVPLTPKDIPNVYVSVLLVKGRTLADDNAEDVSDPGKPAFRLGYATLTVEDASKRLAVGVKANRPEFKPAGTAKVDVEVRDAEGAAAQAEVTLWAVDYGVLSLTAFRTPDVLGSIYMRKALQVINSDNRERLISRRVLTPKGATDGGGGGNESATSELRKDFRALAFWLGSVTTDARGRASVSVKLPESLTTYRIMAVAGDKASRFGSGESEIRVNKPVVLQPAFPRFLTRGDKATFGSVVTNQLPSGGSAVVTMKSLDPRVLEVGGSGRQTVHVPAGGSAEVRFDVTARGLGRGRIQATVRLNGQSDGFEDSIPVEILVPPETVAAYGEASPEATQVLSLPADAIPGFGGLRLELASTALVGLGEGARYVVEYPYGCVEQQSSRAFVMMLAADLGAAFQLPGIDARNLRARVQTTLRELEAFQCASGGFGFWPGDCTSASPYLTSYVIQVYQQAAVLGYDVRLEALERAYGYLERELAAPPPVNEGWWPAYTAWQAFAVKVLADGKRNQDSNINRLYGHRDRLPLFGLTFLHDAMAASRPNDARVAELRRRIANGIVVEAGSAHVEELSDPYLLYFWNSNVRSTAIVLSSLVAVGDGGANVAGLVRWLLGARINGRWGNTQENALAMLALVRYYRTHESVVPDFTATIRLGTEDLVRESFKGRSTTMVARDVPLARLSESGRSASAANVGGDRKLTFAREGAGTLFYAARLSYAQSRETHPPKDQGFRVGRRYALLTEGRPGMPVTSFGAGDLIQVTLTLDLPKERRYVAVRDPLPAGFEAVESWFATTAAQVARPDGSDAADDTAREPEWLTAWRRGTFDHVERHDDRVLLFATRLSEGHHEFSYVVRATTAGVFQVPPARAEEMYSPEIFGQTSSERVEVKP